MKENENKYEKRKRVKKFQNKLREYEENAIDRNFMNPPEPTYNLQSYECVRFKK